MGMWSEFYLHLLELFFEIVTEVRCIISDLLLAKDVQRSCLLSQPLNLRLFLFSSLSIDWLSFIDLSKQRGNWEISIL